MNQLLQVLGGIFFPFEGRHVEGHRLRFLAQLLEERLLISSSSIPINCDNTPS
jgi:hypothetical protein